MSSRMLQTLAAYLLSTIANAAMLGGLLIASLNSLSYAGDKVEGRVQNATPKEDGEKPEIFVQRGHITGVRSIAFSPDDRTILSGGDDGNLIHWDATSGRELRILNSHIGNVTAVAFSPDGRTTLSSGQDNTIKLYDASNGHELRTLKGHKVFVNAVAFSPDGQVVLSGSLDDTLRLWNASSGNELRTLRGHDLGVNAVAFSPDGRTILSGGGDNTLKLWDASSGDELRTLKGHSGAVKAVAFSPDGRRIISGSYDQTIKIWDASSGDELRTLKGGDGNYVNAVAFSPDGRTILSGSSDHTVKIWDTSTGDELRTLKGHRDTVTAVAFSHDGRTILSSSGDSTIKRWDAASGDVLGTLKGHADVVAAVAFSPDGRMILSGYWTPALILWDATNGNELHNLGDTFGLGYHVAFSPEGRTICSVHGPKAHLSDATIGRVLGTSTIKWGGAVRSLAFSRDGCTVVSVSGDNTTFILWNAASGDVLRSLKVDSDGKSVYALALSPDGRTILAGTDKFLKIWDASSGNTLHTLRGHSSQVVAVAFSPDGRTILSGSSDKTLKLWDAAGGSALRTLKGHSSEVVAVAFSPDGRTILSGSRDRTVILWGTASGDVLRTFTGHSGTVMAIGFSSDGRFVLSGGQDGMTRLWEIATGRELAKFVGFDDGEWIVITPEGHYSSSLRGHQNLNIRMKNRVYGVDQFYDVFYRPDIVQAKLRGEDISSLITLTVDDAIKSPPPSVKFTTTPQYTTLTKVRACYRVDSTGGGIGEVRLFQNGKLVKSDGFYREAVTRRTDEKIKLASLDGSAIYRDLRNLKVVRGNQAPVVASGKGNEYEQCQELETVPGENEISVTAFNAANTIQSNIVTIRFAADRKAEEPHLYVLGIGIDKYRDPSVTLQYAAKDANDFRTMIRKKASSLYKPENIHIEGLSDRTATKEGIQRAIQALSGKVKLWDSFILFVASHGALIENQYYIVTAGFDGSANPTNLISSNEIVGMSKNIKSLSQLFIFDTCHAGGVDNIVSGLYDARMSVMAKKMGLHIYASAGTVQEALDGYEGNGLFTHTLLKSMQDGEKTDANKDNQVSVIELGQRARQDATEISKTLGHPQSPYIINFGRDNMLFRVQ